SVTRLDLGSYNNSQSSGNQCVAGSHIPFACRAEARIDVGTPFRDVTEFDGRAAGDARNRAERAPEIVSRGVHMGAARRSNRVVRPGPRFDCLGTIAAAIR